MTTPLVSAENFPSPVKVPERVLVVDGEPLVRWALTASLSAAGYEVVTASTGDDACEIAGRTHPAVVLLDLRPQDTHGQAFFDEIRRVAPACRLLVLTTERRGGASPAWQGAQVIEKPFDLADVVRMVGEAIAI
jgi:two-component system, OmpR family, response regulator